MIYFTILTTMRTALVLRPPYGMMALPQPFLIVSERVYWTVAILFPLSLYLPRFLKIVYSRILQVEPSLIVSGLEEGDLFVFCMRT